MIAVHNGSLWGWLRGFTVPPTVYLFERPDLLNPTFRFYVGNNNGKKATDIGRTIGAGSPALSKLSEFIRIFNEGTDGKYIPVEDRYGCVEVTFGSFRHPGGIALITYGHPDIDRHLGFQPRNRRRISGGHGLVLPRPTGLKIMRNGANSGVEVLDHDGHIWTFTHCRLLITYNDGSTSHSRLYMRIMDEIIILPDGGILLISG